ncbi:kinase-like domain-containing protein [Gigaspora rosea]|uniref:Kinase-like domain-containing protein n=1 Tax=Gigaspora rosea TaxID=44941 RepID=A0A397V6W5_9GLOM|nr:kinase-like domain-containing protein [Gigaspora rosea]
MYERSTFTTDIDEKCNREEESRRVDKSLKEIDESLDRIENKIDNILVQFAPQYDGVKEIPPNELSNLPVLPKENIHIIKRFYNAIEVECKDFNESEDSKDYLAILEKLDSPYILRLYGLSYVDTRRVMVFDCADYGSLKDLYSVKDIPWTRKIQIIRDICRGLIFLRSVNIFHHDLRCENVLMPRNLDPKLTNFNYSRTVGAHTRDLSKLTTNINRWMAPELIKKYKEKKCDEKTYTFNCEMLSFGMLIWELCYEKFPY